MTSFPVNDKSGAVYCKPSKGEAQRMAPYGLAIPNSLLLVRSRASYFLPFEAPIVQISRASTEVRRKAQPAQIREHAVSGGPVNSPPKLRQVDVRAQEGHDVHGSLDGPLQSKVQWHPCQVDSKLKGI